MEKRYKESLLRGSQWLVEKILRWLRAVFAVSLGGSIIVVLGFLVSTAGIQIIRLGAAALVVVVAWILSIHKFHAAFPPQRGSYGQWHVASLLEDNFQPGEEIFQLSVIQQQAKKIFRDLDLVSRDILSQGIPPHLIRVTPHDLQHPIYRADLKGDLSLRNFENNHKMLEAGFGCPIDLSSYLDLPDTVQLRFCLPGSSIRLHQPSAFWTFVLVIGNWMES